MSSLCGADCLNCPWKQTCRGCLETNGSPFGGHCTAAEYCRIGGVDAYRRFKDGLMKEVNALLTSEGLPETDALYELVGEYVNLTYTLPHGETVKFLNDRDIYLCCQIEMEGIGACYGVVADPAFLLLCRYGRDGSDSELIVYKKR